jgi:hypothetical protein
MGKSSLPAWLAECCARLILATRIIDKSYAVVDRARSRLILALASDTVLARFNDLAYGRDVTYDPGSPEFRYGLFRWEEQIITSYFPPAPARVLIGAAGGGREALALAQKGYEVIAFEPCEQLATAAACRIAKQLNVRIYRTRYEDLPCLFPTRSDQPATTLEAEPHFEAAILGWASYSHLRTEAQRIRTLSLFARYVHGPILVSFFPSLREEAFKKEVQTGRVQNMLRKRSRQSDDRFSVYVGFTHKVSAAELEVTANRSGLKILHFNAGSAVDTRLPHAVLFPIGLPQSRSEAR